MTLFRAKSILDFFQIICYFNSDILFYETPVCLQKVRRIGEHNEKGCHHSTTRSLAREFWL